MLIAENYSFFGEKMKTELKYGIKYPVAIAAFSFMAVAFSAIAALLGEIFLAAVVAPLAALYIFEKKERRILSYVISALVVIINFVINGPLSVVGVEAVIISVVIAYSFLRGLGKAECVLWLTVVTSVMLVLALAFAAMNETGIYTYEAVVSFYQNGLDAMKNDFVSNMSLLSSSLGDGTEMLIYTAEEAAALFDMLLNMMLSIIVIISLVLVGIILKIFSAFMIRVSDNPERILSWRFVTPNLFAYFYLTLFVLYFILASSGGALAISVMNLYNIFMAIYAYFGFGYATAFLSKGRSRGFATVMVIIGCVLFSSFAFQILSVLGVFFTINYNKLNPQKPHNTSSTNKGD